MLKSKKYEYLRASRKARRERGVFMPLFPAFLDLADKTVLIVGEGGEAEKKAEKMRLFCRNVVRSKYPPKYAEKPYVVILCERENPDNERLVREFHEMGILVNTADRPELCDFVFPSLITGGEVSVGISTNGTAPVLGALLRERVENIFPDDMEKAASAAKELTEELRRTVPDAKQRGKLLREMIEQLLREN